MTRLRAIVAKSVDTSSPEKDSYRLVYELYGLTEDEIEIVEGASSSK
jgi:hypothetical protein